MNSYIARQPIFDRDIQIHAYELLFRGGAHDSAYNGVDADQASSRIIMESFNSLGLDTITGGKPAFINFTSNLLTQNVATLFPKDMLVIEILEDVEPTPEVIAVCRDLRGKGYTIALDDFEYRPEFDPLIELCDIIKVDFLLLKPRQIRALMDIIGGMGKTMLAEKIETKRMFDYAAGLGFSLFQGYFFSKPVTLTAKNLSPLKSNYMRLLKEMNAEQSMDFEKLAGIIRNDVALSYKLLRLVNSAYYSLRVKVTDIKHALTVLGTKEIRKWISLISMMGLSTDKPDELVKMSMIRGRFMERMGPLCGIDCSAETLFLTGLFSLIGVLTDQPIEVALADMVLAPELRDALVRGSGQLYDLMQIVTGIEKGAWDSIDRVRESLGVGEEEISDVYLEAVKWCNEMPM